MPNARAAATAVYVLDVTATDPAGAACTATAIVSVPHDESGAAAVDSGAQYDSLVP